MSQIVLLALCIILAFGLGYFFGYRLRQRRLQSALRHAQHELNELHVQYMNLSEVVNNQELEIKRYAAELQLFAEMQRIWLEEKTQLQIALDQAGHVKPAAQTDHLSHESYLLMVNLWKKEIAQLDRAIEAKTAENESIKKVMQFLSQENKRLRQVSTPQAGR